MLMYREKYEGLFITREPWQTVALRLRHGDASYIPANLVDWPVETDDVDNLSEDMLRLLLAMILVRGEKPADDLPMAEHCQEAESWGEVPLLAHRSDGTVRIVPVLLGYAETETFHVGFEEGVLSPRAQAAARTALNIWGTPGRWWLVSRLSPQSLQEAVDETSIALPLALAAVNLIEGHDFAPQDVMLFAAGNMDSFGFVSAVRDLPGLVRCALENGEYAAHFMLVPEDNLYGTTPQDVLLPVSDVLDAPCLQFMCQQPDASIRPIADRLPVWRKDPAGFLDQVAQGSIRPLYLLALLGLAEQSWFANLEEQKLADLLPGAVAVLQRLAQDVETLRRERKNVSGGEEAMKVYETLPERFLKLFPLEKLASLPASLELMQVAQAWLRLPDLDREEGAGWSEQVERCRRSLVWGRAGASLEELAAILQTLPENHSSYRFLAEDLPASLISSFEKAQAADDPLSAHCAYRIFRHHAFCGAYDEAASFAQKALETARDPALRQQCLLDRMTLNLTMGRMKEACEDLCAAAGRERTRLDLSRAVAESGSARARLYFSKLCKASGLEEQGADALDVLLAVQAAGSTLRNNLFVTLCHEIGRDVFATFLAPDLHTLKEPAELCTAFLRLCFHVPLLFPYKYKRIHSPMGSMDYAAGEEHPWEQWHYFYGRLLLAEDRQKACVHFQEGLKICLSQTRALHLYPMALLPLSALAAEELRPQEELHQTTTDVLARLGDLCASGQLYEPHFHDLLSMQPEEVLREVADHPQTWFPFTFF